MENTPSLKNITHSLLRRITPRNVVYPPSGQETYTHPVGRKKERTILQPGLLFEEVKVEKSTLVHFNNV